jgi:pimeloyl-ACP methyl ester carboxylesterase
VALRRIELADGRHLAADDVGDPHGRPVLYLHGLPDSRLARHPDDRVAAAAGVRLLAVDRPGAGDSDLDPSATPTSLGADLVALLDALELPRARLLGWSSGGLAALAAATVEPGRVEAVTLVAPVPPAEAYDDPAVLAALGPTRLPLVELGSEMGPAELAAEVAPHLVPQPLTPELALEHVLEGAGEQGRAELVAVPGSAEALADGLQAGLAHGLEPLEQDLRHQLTPGLHLDRLTMPVRTVHGERDGTSPPEVGAWLAAHLPACTAETIPGAGHHLLFPYWERLLREA